MRWWCVALGEVSIPFKAPNKPIKEGYKIFALCEAGYTYSFMWSSKSHSYGELRKQPDLAPTQSMVYQLAQLLPQGQPHVIYMDNLFTRVPLLRKLREIEIGACGTTRRHLEFPLFLLDLKETCSKHLEWNTIAAIIVRKRVRIKKENDESESESDSKDPGVLCFAWQDNNTVIACSTYYCTQCRQWVYNYSIKTAPSIYLHKWIPCSKGL